MNPSAPNEQQSLQQRPQHRHRRSTNGSFGGGERAQPNGSGQHNMLTSSVQRPVPPVKSDGTRADILGMARSPPKSKNTSHVPCKFYLQGQCQAGRTCPFSHDLESTTRPAPCKYFAKGHCKFGAKCALLHVTSEGVVVNRRPMAPAPFPNNGHVLPGGFGAAPTGLLSLQAQGLDLHTNGEYNSNDQGGPYRQASQGVHGDYTSASPIFGSPPLNNGHAVSPPRQRGLSVLDVPLPNSFDSNGVSVAARNGPFAASMPSRFGLESPPASLPRNAYLNNTAIFDLHNSAFGDGSAQYRVQDGSSPPSGDEPLTFPKRSLLSERFNTSRAVFSASVGTKLPSQSFEYSDEEPDTDQEESLLPASLRDLIPEGRSRRESRSHKDDDTPASFLAAQRRTLSSNTTPQESKVGSPSFSSSPSRYSGMFAQRSTSSDFVGSPLRNAGFVETAIIGRSMSNTDLAPSVSSPPRQASMSMLTQELQRTKLDQARNQAGAPLSIGVPVRTLSNGSNTRKSLDRNVSSTSLGRARIDEEQELFDMDEISGPAKPSPRPQSSDSRNGDASIGSRLFSQVARNGAAHGAIGSHRVK